MISIENPIIHGEPKNRGFRCSSTGCCVTSVEKLFHSQITPIYSSLCLRLRTVFLLLSLYMLVSYRDCLWGKKIGLPKAPSIANDRKFSLNLDIGIYLDISAYANAWRRHPNGYQALTHSLSLFLSNNFVRVVGIWNCSECKVYDNLAQCSQYARLGLESSK